MAFATIDVTKGITGVTPVANGGTGATSFSPGKIGQVVHSKNTTYRSITSTTFVECNSVTITPSATSSKILVFNSACITKNNASQGTERMFRVVGGSDVATQVLTDLVAYTNNTDVNNVGFSGTQFYDTPSSVAAITYSYRICSTGDTSSVEYNNYSSAGSFSGQITAMEILA